MITLRVEGRGVRFLRDEEPLTPALPLGPLLLAQHVLRHVPPTAYEVEAAIEQVEDLLMPLHGGWPADGELHVEGDPALLAAVERDAQRVLDRDSLEEVFSRAVAVAQGRPQASDPLLAQPEVVALLVLVREAMHHLGFATVRFSR